MRLTEFSPAQSVEPDPAVEPTLVVEPTPVIEPAPLAEPISYGPPQWARRSWTGFDLLAPILCCNPMAPYAVQLVIL